MTPLLQKERDLSQTVSLLGRLQLKVISDSAFAYDILVHASRHIGKQQAAVSESLKAYFAEDSHA